MGSVPGPTQSTDAWKGGWPQTPEDFEKMVDAFLRPLVQYAFRRVGNIHDAEDIVQEVFVRGYARRLEYAKVSPVGPYLYRMTANACIDLLRKRKRLEAPPDTSTIESVANGRQDASELCAAAEELRRAEELVGRLPKKQAEAVRLRAFEGLRMHEIAEVIGCSINTVGSRLRYGFKRLRRIVSKEWKR